MRRIVVIGVLVVVAALVAIAIASAASDDDQYEVRAIFDNASTLVEGEDVKVAGVPVGVVSDMDVTEDNKAAVTLRIDEEDFTPFKTDASCRIVPQSLIGEKFVECEPGSTAAEPLRELDGGEHLLPVRNTSSPVDLDLVNDIMRRPYRERFAILLSELGTGLAGRGEQLNEVIHRANPALRETDRVLNVLAGQNRTLARLARDSDQALAPLARERERVADFIVQANETAQASAERRGDLRLSIERLPEFLRQLRLLMVDIEDLSDQGTPLVADLGQAAPALGRLIEAQGTLADSARESFPSLGDALERGRPALIRARPLIRDLGRLGDELAPTSVNLDELTKSIDETGGVERINDFLYYVALATNGFDTVGHYLRAGLVTNTCSSYAVNLATNCLANFFDPFEGASTSKEGELEPRNAPAPKGQGEGSVAPTGTLLGGLLGQDQGSPEALQRDQSLKQLRERSEGDSPALGPREPMLDYLLGGEER